MMKAWRRRGLMVLAIIGGLAGEASFARAEASQADLAVAEPRFDPAVRRGRLANGLSYAILRNGRPEGAASLRLMIDAGSFEEADGERGLAHFLEHMAFNGTRRFPEGALQRRFAEAGVAFGRDQNASTTAFATVYSLDLSRADEARLDLAFDWLSDVADGLLLAPEAVERERGVVLAEHDGRLGPAWEWRQRYNAFAAPGLRGPERLPIGTREGIRGVTPEALTAFYGRWYRPDHAVVVVVGDVDEADVERRIGAAFGGWTAEAPAPERKPVGVPNLDRGLEVMTGTARQQGSAVSLCRTQAFESWGPDSLERRRRNIERALWQTVLARRMARRAQGEAPPFTSAALQISSWPRELAYACLNITPRTDDAWREALTAAVAEVRRMEAHGIDPAELERAIRQQREMNASAVAKAGSRFSSGLAAELLNAQPVFGLDPAGFSTPEENARLYDLIAAEMTPERVNAAFRRDWSGSEPLISIGLTTPPRAGAVKSAWRRAMAGRPPAKEGQIDRAGWAYADFGPPGTVVERQEVEAPGFVRLRFANGVVVNFKTATFTRDQVSVTARFGAGLREIAPEDTTAAQFGAGLLTVGGLGRHGALDYGDLFPNRRFSVALSMGDDSFALSGVTRPQDMEVQLQMFAAYLTDPGFRPDFEAARLSRLRAFYRSHRTEPSVVASVGLMEAVAPGGPRAMPSLETMEGIDQSVVRRLFEGPLRTAPLEVTVVGDIEEAAALPYLAATLGALPARPGARRDRGDAWFVRYPETVAPVSLQHEGDGQRALARLVWPLYVASPERRREERALGLLRLVLAEEVRDAVRERLGAAYTPGVSLSMPDHGDQGALTVSAGTGPDQVEAVIAAMRETASRLAQPGGITAEALEAARTPMLEGARTRRQNNNWWVEAMDGSYRDPQVIRDALTWEDEYRSLTLEEVQAAATAWLSAEPIEVRVLPKSSAEAMPARP